MISKLPQDNGPEPQLDELGNSEAIAIGQAVRLNLATCLLRICKEFGEVVSLCNEVLTLDPNNVKALYRRGMGHNGLANATSDTSSRKAALQSARRDLVQAAKASPSDKEIRKMLEQVTSSLQQLQSRSGGWFGAGGCGLYDDKSSDPAAPPPPPVICDTCGLEGHPRCGKQYWIDQRAAWLGMPKTDVEKEPDDFEDNGTLLAAIRAAHRIESSGVRDISEEECEMLEDCIECTDKPYPKLKQKLPLTQAVHCAEKIWHTNQ